MQVLKFGGSSVANATNISRVLDIVGAAAKKTRVMLICSAIKGCTDELLALAETPDLQKAIDLEARHLEIIRRLFTGAERAETEAECHSLFAEMAASPADEMVTFGEIFSTRIIARKLACDGVMTKWLDSRILVIKDNKDLTYSNISAAVALNPDVQVFVAPGFIASTYEGKRTTLGRGGSDLSASIFAAALQADDLQIWTDVPGIMTANPKDVPVAHTVPEMSYRAALDMASAGAKVLYAPSVQPAMDAGIAIRILNTFDPENPGTVVSGKTGAGWTGVASMTDKTADEALLTLVGETPTDGKAAAERVQRCLRKAGIKTLSASSDGVNVHASVKASVENAALCAIHREFFENAPESVINLYVAGYGAVGKAFEELLKERGADIAARSGRVLRIAGLAKSHRDKGFIDKVKAEAPRGSIFVDLPDFTAIRAHHRCHFVYPFRVSSVSYFK